MRLQFKLGFICFASFLILGCKKGHEGDCFMGTGEDVTVTRSLEHFTGVRIEDRFEVELIDTNASYVEITGGSKLLAGITSEVENNVLIIRNENGCNHVRDYRRLMKIKVYGVLTDIWHDTDGTITNLNHFSNDTIFFHLTGSDANFDLNNKFFFSDMYQTGSLTLTGSCEQIRIDLTSYGSFYGTNLDCKNARVVNAGEGDLYVHVTDTLDAKINRVGNIYYSGKPDHISTQISGEGAIFEQ